MVDTCRVNQRDSGACAWLVFVHESAAGASQRVDDVLLRVLRERDAGEHLWYPYVRFTCES